MIDEGTITKEESEYLKMGDEEEVELPIRVIQNPVDEFTTLTLTKGKAGSDDSSKLVLNAKKIMVKTLILKL